MNSMQHVSKMKNQLSLLYFAVLGLLVFLPCAPFLMVLALFSVIFPNLMNLYYWILLQGIHFYLKISPVKYQFNNLNILGENNRNKCVIIANHRSHLDMYLFLSEVYKVRAVANSYLLKVPIVGQVLWMSGHFVVKAGNIEAYKRALKNIVTAFERQDKVLFFPEMHRCEPGLQGMNKFHLTGFQLARENNVNIIPVVIHGTDKVWPKNSLSADFSHPVSIKALNPVNPKDFPDTASLAAHVKKLMLDELKVMQA
jgi:1-acyl-sn-glycerol-3-phosphate acyltransferase